ncbi:MAG TPA: RodZ domain-containing protein [Rhodanobacteraceae bacterium]|nr:RodZ domain-containing protein [Rhodanobacteraceae bacterium]
MRAEDLEHDAKASSDETSRPADDMPQAKAESPSSSFGERLRAGREAKGLSRADAAQRLKLPLRLIERIEADDYAGIEEGVYLRGYLSSYARLVDVPVVAAETIAAQHTRAAPLVATGKVSRSRYLFDRYSVSATYLILTALIVVPAVWLATHGGLEQNLVRTTPLDAPAVTIPLPAQAPATSRVDEEPVESAPASAADAPADTSATVAAVEPPKQERMPVIASMTPFTSSPSSVAPAVESSATAARGAHSLTLKLTQPSWVEIVGSDGSKLEYSLLPAGAERTYSSDGPLSLRLGNADGAEVRLDGKPLDLAPFRRANVARLRVFGDNGAEAAPAEF